ncbi:lysozyme [Secundilactobacillus pentosiphilus]|uniref:Lysozyme n=1 Tax=Secundilactobacillus pentosiphilus TaxID=1714682 RepID=A0A1Z5IQT6_9LACO|nr:GH25 family lysozyme [Secundilactobacillus pentosiphilus]GAX03791.1 lysozyme [Secundilactobacillus pentosiphilus]
MKRRRIEPIYTNTYKQLRNRSRRLRFFSVLLILAVIFGGWFGYRHYRDQQLSHYLVKGVALSQSNGFVDFQQLAQKEVQFAYLRATSGATYTDDQFQSSYDRSQGSHLAIGVYHVYSYTTSPQAQLKNFEEEVGQRHGQLPIAVQVTTYGDYDARYLRQAAPQKRLQQFMSLLRQHYDKRLIIWCTPSIWQSLDRSSLGRYRTWVQTANLSHQNQRVAFIGYNANATIKLNGQSQTVGAVVFNGSKRQWRSWITQ